MKKRLLSALLAVSLTASLMLSGCAETPTPTSTVPVVTTAPTTVPTTVPPETTIPIETTTPSTTAPEETTPVVTEPSETISPETTAPTSPSLSDIQLNSLNMLNYLAVITEEIRVSKDNRLVLEDIYTELINEINPSAVDNNTQLHLSTLRDIISDFQSIDIKRDRLQYIHNRDLALAMRNAVPNPLSVLSVSNALDWKRLAISVGYTMIDSYTKYKDITENANLNYLTSGWELNDYETETIKKSRNHAFDYMADVVQEYGKELGIFTLNEKAVEDYINYTTKEDIYEKIGLLESARETYKYFGDYWLEMADCYFSAGKYRECLDCIETYYSLDTGIFRKDYNVAHILPKAIVAVQELYKNDKDKYIYYSELYAAEIDNNTNLDEWSLKYFAAQVYLDLYRLENDSTYLDTAYGIIKNNVTHLIANQKKLNDTYKEDIVKLSVEEPNYDYMGKTEKKEAKEKYKAEKEIIDAYNAELTETRKTELPSLYEPLILNCDLLFALADKKEIDEAEKVDISNLLNGVFLTKPIHNRYSFDSESIDYSTACPMTMKKDKLVIPVELLTSETTFTVTVTTDSSQTTFTDWKITEVARKGKNISDFYAYVTSETMSTYKWSLGAEIEIQINNGTSFPMVEFEFTVTEYADNSFLPDTVVFE